MLNLIDGLITDLTYDSTKNTISRYETVDNNNNILKSIEFKHLYAHHITITQNLNNNYYVCFTLISTSSEAFTFTSLIAYFDNAQNYSFSSSRPISATGSYSVNEVVGIYAVTSGSVSIVYQSTNGTMAATYFNMPINLSDVICKIY